jgi:hypothetical protein
MGDWPCGGRPSEGWRRLRICLDEGEASNPKLTPLNDLDSPKIDVSKLNSKKVVELMTQVGLL